MPLQDVGRNAGIAAIGALLDGGKLQLMDSGLTTVLAELTFGSPAFGSPSSGTITATSISSVSASNTGNAEAFRLRKSDNTLVLERSDTNAVSATGGGGAIVINAASTSIVSGQTISVSSFTYTLPAGT